ncbi:MAG: ribonuclease E inhibitor RraB [Thiotrichaceae bacterium]|nr:ribonuclease E inhibitor RraB [Thiotrichaceae bacterium]PCI11524.1 MAG: hypothetical protein COB71_11400 [Thiotrichales bacterium]
MDFPKTDDGEILREMHQAGINLSATHNIDFFINFGKKKDAEKMQAEVESNGTEGRFALDENETHDGWVLCCTIAMIPRHDDIIEVERAFDKVAATHQGESDGWGMLQPEG